ncbi:MAG: STAS domain-containing protein [Candidatus Krumholzibacteriia bacterium]
MPRESTRQAARQEATRTGMEIQVRQDERAVWVALSGILDQDGVAALAGRVAPALAGRGCRVVLDGSGLAHMDYRATAELVAWGRKLKAYRHQLYLQGWSDYLKSILIMGNWDGDGEPAPGLPTLRHLGSLAPVRMP